MYNQKLNNKLLKNTFTVLQLFEKLPYLVDISKLDILM